MSPKRSADTSTDFSAGGVVLRGGLLAVVVPVKRSFSGQRVLGLPKGHPKEGESPEAAATREVREETGLNAKLVEKLGDVYYSFVRAGRRRDKRVTFYLFEYESGDLRDHDHEIEDARWIPADEAVRTLTYSGEREMVERALSRSMRDR
ncbi:MAG TPA: NUDIX hydrolase [Solirubrobacteraceae bacterium]|jgi:8-oxo-dGTP pyrophosphatase MutT (NUDIX family)